MRIAIDAREIMGKAGKARYVRELIINLSKVDRANQYFLYVWEKPAIRLSSNFKFVVLPKGKVRLLWLRSDLAKNKINVFLSPTGYHPVIFSSVPSVLVVHDLAVFVEKHSRPALKTKIIEKMSLPLALKRADRVIADSENTRQDLIKYFKVDPAKIILVLLAPFDLQGEAKSENEVRKKYHLPDKYALFVGTLEPRKNVDGLIRAYAGLPDQLKKQYPLVLAGKRGWHTEVIDKAIRETGVEKHLVETGYLSDEDLPALYQMATVFIYPSWYEGFGLPPLEAMRYGAPVITSNRSSLPEVVGKAALLVDPADEAEISAALEKLLKDGKLRDELALRGKERAKEFSWEKTAQQTLQVLKTVGEKR